MHMHILQLLGFCMPLQVFAGLVQSERSL